MVYNNDIYYTPSPRSIQSYRITNTGIPRIIANGHSEHLLYTDPAIWMSSDGHLMLYGIFNNTLVEEQYYTWYGTTNSTTSQSNLYPEIRRIR